MKIDVCVVHFKSLSLQHLEAAWFSIEKNLPQPGVRRVVVLDNASGQWPLDVQSTVGIFAPRGHPQSVPVDFWAWQQAEAEHTHSWTVNMMGKVYAADAEWIFFTRSDYILAFDALPRMMERARSLEAGGAKPFVTGWCWQMGIDAQLSNTDAHVDIERYGWREKGMAGLREHPFGVEFKDTVHDAGVWLTKRAYLQEAGWMNEALTAWGFQQSAFQRQLVRRGVVCEVIPDFLFAHQHHAADRDFKKAADEYQRFGGGA